MVKISRPALGERTVVTLDIHICSTCGRIIEAGTGLCEYECPNDGVPRDLRPYVLARYERTDVFVGDFSPKGAQDRAADQH